MQTLAIWSNWCEIKNKQENSCLDKWTYEWRKERIRVSQVLTEKTAAAAAAIRIRGKKARQTFFTALNTHTHTHACGDSNNELRPQKKHTHRKREKENGGEQTFNFFPPYCLIHTEFDIYDNIAYFSTPAVNTERARTHSFNIQFCLSSANVYFLRTVALGVFASLFVCLFAFIRCHSIHFWKTKCTIDKATHILFLYRLHSTYIHFPYPPGIYAVIQNTKPTPNYNSHDRNELITAYTIFSIVQSYPASIYDWVKQTVKYMSESDDEAIAKRY